MGFHPDKHRAASNNRSLTEPGSWTSENSSAHSQEPDLTSVATLEHAAPALDWAGAKHAGLGTSGAGPLRRGGPLRAELGVALLLWSWLSPPWSQLSKSYSEGVEAA